MYKIYAIMGDNQEYPGDAGPYPIGFCDELHVAQALIERLNVESAAWFAKAEAWRVDHEPWREDPEIDITKYRTSKEGWDARYAIEAAARAALADLAWDFTAPTTYAILPIMRYGYGHVSYDQAFGDDNLCECSHTYYRHFDSYDDMASVGCKYCDCCRFVQKA